ncbi:MAG: hypothetical protein AB7G15_09655 [Alphaproteobacteria bacterium]
MSETPPLAQLDPAGIDHTTERPGLSDLAWLALVTLFIAAVLAVWGWWLAPR